MSKVRDFAEIISTGVASTDVSGLTTAITNEFTSIEHVSPSYIRTALLYPAVLGNITNGTAHTGTYGDTVQTDGHKYYYTDIKGSKPIKDPRIGAHFGSQRHGFKSIQLLEQETATHGDKVYSIDGREWMRVVGDIDYVNGTGSIYVKIESATSSFFEITGYFNAFNFINYTSDTNRSFKVEIDGVTAHTGFNPNGVVNSPLGVRYVSAGSVFNVDLTSSSSLSSDTTLGIHTLRMSYASGYGNYPTGCELIVQDTTDTASKSKIQIPAQTVISFNKQHSVSATAQHYDPFNGFTTGDLAAVQALGIDDTTSLGLDAWWYSNSSVYYRPYNGGRVVKWVDSLGTIKTSVNMMPFNATSIDNLNINKKENASASNNNPTPSFIAGAIDSSQAEVAKTFHYREFGNGSANGNSSWKDASWFTSGTGTDIAYVMDDGLTSLSGKGGYITGAKELVGWDTGLGLYIIFIGTGVSFICANLSSNTIHAQNLPYGTHILKSYRAAGATTEIIIDGVPLAHNPGNQGGLHEVTFYQPKMPPIPEDAVILADYMLMADFVGQTSDGIQYISKGTRLSSCSRDMFAGGTGGESTLTHRVASDTGFNHAGTTSTTWRLPAFCTNFVLRGYDTDTRDNIYVDTTNKDSVATHASSGYGSASYLNSANELTLGVNKIGHNCVSSDGNWGAYNIVSPIHTSSHYQTFETPFLHELVGGDRNMEQTNLVVTSDGKTWDEVTRNTSYMGASASILISRDGGNVDDGAGVINWDYFRGRSTEGNYHTKGFAPSYNEIICLVDGTYDISMMGFTSESQNALAWYFKINGTTTSQGSCSGTTTRANYWATHIVRQLKRGDALSLTFAVGHIYAGAPNALQFNITKVGNRK